MNVKIGQKVIALKDLVNSFVKLEGKVVSIDTNSVRIECLQREGGSECFNVKPDEIQEIVS